MKKEYLFTNNDLKKLIVPLVFEQLLAILVGLVDSIMVASVGEAAVSAVSLIDTVMVLLINAFSAMAMGGAIIAGQALGRKHKEDACDAYEQTLILAVAAALLIMLAVYAGKWFILQVVFGKIEPDVMVNCNSYLMITTISIPFLAIYNTGAAMFRTMGDSKMPMKMSMVMNLVNVVGNAILLYGLKWGIEGAAIPTALSRTLSGIWMLFLMRDRSKMFYVRSFRIRMKMQMQKKILHIAIPFTLENSMFQMGKVLLLSLVSGFGTASIAANAVANTMCSFAVISGSSVGFSMSAVTSRCVGAGDYEQVRYYTRKLLKITYVGMVLTNIILFSLLPLVMRAYNLSPETAEIAGKIIIYHGICAMLIWSPSFNIPNVLRAANDVGYCMWVSIASMWVCRIAMAYLLAGYLQWGVFGVWVAMTLDWLVRAICFVGRYRGTKWIKKTI